MLTRLFEHKLTEMFFSSLPSSSLQSSVCSLVWRILLNKNCLSESGRNLHLLRKCSYLRPASLHRGHDGRNYFEDGIIGV